jgi:hypothetical protein
VVQRELWGVAPRPTKETFEKSFLGTFKTFGKGAYVIFYIVR